MHDSTLLLILLVIVLGINAAVSIAVLRSGIYSTSQVIAQTAIVWLVPLLGAAVVGLLLRSQEPEYPVSTEGEDHNRWQGGENGANDQHDSP